MILPIYTDDQPVLRQQTETVTEFDANLAALVADMRETMHNADGVGLAAPQVGKLLKLFVVEYEDPDGYDSFPFTAFINPQIVWRSPQKSVYEEACLSVPGTVGKVKRPAKVTVRYQDVYGNWQEMSADKLFARVIQHENDHLKGILFTDYVPEGKRDVRDVPDYPRI